MRTMVRQDQNIRSRDSDSSIRGIVTDGSRELLRETVRNVLAEGVNEPARIHRRSIHVLPSLVSKGQKEYIRQHLCCIGISGRDSAVIAVRSLTIRAAMMGPIPKHSAESEWAGPLKRFPSPGCMNQS